ncbi:TY-Chap domain-containing protein [Catellatospora methionotrophica]|uniref:TY-Chap domain-containing protein n=1 Tax=Catellatospora methionotrophica TaxID=121620 RepID=UPI0033DBEA5F
MNQFGEMQDVAAASTAAAALHQEIAPEALGDEGWLAFAASIAAGTGCASLNDAVIIDIAGGRFLQWVQNVDSITVNISDNDEEPLTADQRTALADQGWQAPTWAEPTWNRDIRWQPSQDMFDMFAVLITVTLRVHLGVQSAFGLQIRSFNLNGGARYALPMSAIEYQRACTDVSLRLADLQLHDAAAALVIEKESLAAALVVVDVMPADRRPTEDESGAYFLDRILLVEGDDPHIAIWSHVAPGGRAASRVVPDHPPQPGRPLRAEQGNPIYVRYLLQHSAALAAALHADPALRDRMSGLLASGRADAVRAMHIEASTDGGGIRVTTMLLAPEKLDCASIALPAAATRGL